MRYRWKRFLTILLTMAALVHNVTAAQKPDIVFIIADDLGSADVGWRGGEINTPHLDKLANAGVKLDQFYVQPVCSPTRAALMTGRYPMRYGLQVGVIRPWANYGLSLEERLLPEGLKEVGYTTVICGKWHLGSTEKAYWPDARGFDHWYGHLLGAINYFDHTREGKIDWYRNGNPLKEEGYSTHLVAREAVKMIRNQPTGTPLFLYVPFNAVHGPYQVPESYKEAYKHLPESRQTYAGMVAAMDEAIGQIVAAVDETKRRKNTLFIFCSDNGGPGPGRLTRNTPFRNGKGSVYDGGVHTCAFATWDGRLKPGNSTALMHISDWYPTLLKLTGASLKQKLPLDGHDIWPCLTQGKPSTRQEILLNTTPNTGAIRVGDWKLVINGEKHDAPDETSSPERKKKNREAITKTTVELFNLATDPREGKNIADMNPGKVNELRARYDILAKQAVTPKNRAE